MSVAEPATVTLAEFLLARIAEDESLAREALAARKPPWVSRANTAMAWSVNEGHHEVLVNKTASANGGANGFILRTDQAHDAALADYVVSWQPDRVLAECEAKRRVWNEVVVANGAAALHLLGLLALPYRDHPDYRAEWAL